MPIPKHVEARYAFWKLFKVGQRIRRKKDGEIFIVGRTKDTHSCWLMRLTPAPSMRVTASWSVLLSEFESDAGV